MDFLGDLVGDAIIAMLPLDQSSRARVRAYRRGRPVFIRASFEGGYRWADHLLCHGPRLWVVTNKGFENEERVELYPDRGVVEIDRHVGWSTGPRVALETHGHQRLVISSSLADFDLLVEAVENWRTTAVT